METSSYMRETSFCDLFKKINFLYFVGAIHCICVCIHIFASSVSSKLGSIQCHSSLTGWAAVYFAVYRRNSRTAVRLKVLEMLASLISTNSVLYRVSHAPSNFFLATII